MSDGPPLPGDTLSAAQDAAEEAGAEAAAEAAPGAEGAPDILSALMHTEPNLSPSEVSREMGVGPGGSHAFVGLRKVIHAVTGTGGGSGTPALANFGAAGYHAFTGLDVGDRDDDGDEETADVDDVLDEAGIDMRGL